MMRGSNKIWIVLIVVLLVVLGGLFWFYTLLDRLQKEYKEGVDEVKVEIARLERAHPDDPKKALTDARFGAFLRIRGAVARRHAERLKDEDKPLDHGLKTQIQMLETMVEGLQKEKMCLSEYKRIGDRMRSILARGAAKDAPPYLAGPYAEWVETFKTAKDDRGPQLPPPWNDAPEEELKRFDRFAEAITHTMAGDWPLRTYPDLLEKKTDKPAR